MVAAENELNGQVLERSPPTSPVTGQVLSRDGTKIAFECLGRGPSVILVDGALCHRRMGPGRQLASALSKDFTVFTYDRRGRGESCESGPYAVQREIEDLAALLAHAGGQAFVWGTSSGAILALEAALRLSGIRKLALYEAPLIVDDSRPTTEHDWMQIGEAVAANRRSEAVGLFLRCVGVPRVVVAVMRLTPVWSKLKASAHTLPYDGAIVKDIQRGYALPTDRWAAAKLPVLVTDGGASPAWMRHGNRSLADVLPNATYQTLDGETHVLKAKPHAPVLTKFFKA